jgi:hypothetical protein
MRRVHETIVAVEKQKVALVIQHPKYMRLIMPSVACLVLHIFSRHRTIGTIFGKKEVTEYKLFLIIYTASARYIFHSKKNAARCCHKCT